MKKKSHMKIMAILTMVCMIFTVPTTAFGATADSSQGTVPVEIKATRYDAAAQEVLDLVNEEREQQGLRPLTIDSELQEAAMTRAAEITICFNHIRPDGTSCTTVLPDKMAGENIAVGYGSPTTVVNAWMNSSGHRANILNSSYNSIGVGCVYYNGVWFWTQAFGRVSGDGDVDDESSTLKTTANMMTSLVELTWLGDTKIDLAEEDAESLKVQIGGTNPGWEYMTYELDNHLLTYKSSDESILQVGADGSLTPVSVGTATITATLNADSSRQLTQEVRIVRTLKAEDVTLSRTSYTYNGKAKKPTVTVKGLTEDDYVISYKNNVKVGTATVTITGVGDVDGTVKKTFKINHDRPDKVTLKKPTTGSSHYVKVRWYAEDCDGYAIRYSTSKTFKTYKTVYVKDGDAVSKTIKKLTKGKRYYVKVRAYNLYEGTRIYGSFSNWKSVVCK